MKKIATPLAFALMASSVSSWAAASDLSMSQKRADYEHKKDMLTQASDFIEHGQQAKERALLQAEVKKDTAQAKRSDNRDESTQSSENDAIEATVTQQGSLYETY